MPNAESDLARRMLIAAKTIGFEIVATSSKADIAMFNPDVVIPMYFSIPKLFDAFKVGCMWNPAFNDQRLSELG